MRAVFDALLAVLLAPECAACGAPLPHPTGGCVCEPCWRSISSVTERARLREVAGVLDSVRSVGVHDGALRAIVHALKYDGRRSLAQPLAALMRHAAADLLDTASAVVPVPLHPSKRRARGFNQAHDLARHLGLPVVHALRRTRATDTQTGLAAAERYANVAGAFLPTRQTRTLEGLVVVLVDDVRTTGATLEACATVLKGAGVREVRAVTAARAEIPPV